jgi:hypothetical protein
MDDGKTHINTDRMTEVSRYINKRRTEYKNKN